jgi:PglZ domain
MKAQVAKSLGLVDALLASFNEALRTTDAVAAPIALLWTDADSQWQELVTVLRGAIPHLYSLGPYNPQARIGPAIWLRCVVDRAIPEVAPPEGTTPILYLRGVSRQVLRGAADCPPLLQPLIELQYRGRVWHQPNGRDWSVEAFLTSEHGLGLNMALDDLTREAMLRALPLLAETPLDGLRGKRLEAEDFDRLTVPDSIRELLRWMSAPEAFRRQANGARWEAFRNICRSEFGFDPENDGAEGAAALLATDDGKWDAVWDRFCEAPRLYAGIPDLLRSPLASQGKLLFDSSRNPAENDYAEERLRTGLIEVSAMPHPQACARVLDLEAEHRKRRDWVWARLGESPLAMALEPLTRLARLAQSSLGAATLESMIEVYSSEGWRCDRAAIEALASPKSAGDGGVVARAMRALYEPWLDASARRFQELVAARGDLRPLMSATVGEHETCTLFVDGLRFDLGSVLAEKLEVRSLRTRITQRLSPLPTVTGTAKPFASPAAAALKGVPAPDDFCPVIADSGQSANASRLREAMEQRGVEIISEDDLRIPSGAAAGAWTEHGRLDELGHKLQAALAAQVDNELEQIADRVVALLDAGWMRVRVVTDHGWLLLPGGLPSFALPPYLVETKWSRCAMVRGNSAPDVPTYRWYWNPDARIASPPGIACFRAGSEYAHGGVSPQECIVPEIVVERAAPGLTAEIVNVQWRGMRCRVTVRASGHGIRVDLRTNWKQSNTSIVSSPKEASPSGEVSLVVEDDRHEGSSAMLVAIDSGGNVLDRKLTTVGDEK